MILQLLSRIIFSTAFLQMFPYDAGVVEHRALAPDAAERPVPPLAQVFSSLDRMRSLGDSSHAPVKIQPTSVGAVTSAVSAIVIDRATGTVLYEKNAQEPRSIGSITKLMTVYVFLQGHPDLNAPASLEQEDVEL